MCRLCKKLSQILNPVLNVPKIYHNQSLISYSPLIIEKHIFALATLVHSSTSVVLEGAGRETPVDRCYLYAMQTNCFAKSAGKNLAFHRGRAQLPCPEFHPIEKNMFH